MPKFDAMEYAEQLSALKFFPTHPVGAAKVAEIIAELCESQAQAETLVADMLSEFDEWPGPKTLRDVYRERFKPTGERAEYRQRFTGTPPPILCASCNDIGFYQHGDVYRRCVCEAGEHVKDSTIEAFNAEGARRKKQTGQWFANAASILPNVVQNPISQAQVDAEIAKRKRREN